MLDKIQTKLTPARRKWAYGVTCAGVALLATYGVLNGEQAAAWLYLASAVLGMATAKTDTSTKSGMPAGEQ